MTKSSKKVPCVDRGVTLFVFWYPELHLPLVVLFCFPHEKCGYWQISYGPLQNENTSCQLEKWQFAYSSDVWRKQRSQVVLSLVSPTLMMRTRRGRYESLNQVSHHCLNILSHCSSWSNASSWGGGGVVCPCPTTAGWPLSHAGGGGSRQVDILLAPSYRYTTTPRSARWSFLLMRADGSWPLCTLVKHVGNCDCSKALHNSRHK